MKSYDISQGSLILGGMTADASHEVVGVDEARRRLPEYLSNLEQHVRDEIEIGAYRRVQGALVSKEALDELHEFRELKRRAKAAASAAGSTRAEGLELPETSLADAEDYVAGVWTTDELVKRAIARHYRD